MTGEEFVAELERENNQRLERLAELSAAGDAPASLTVDKLLRVALKNELEATEIAALWLGTTDELDVKLALARQAGDEAKHYRLIAERLGEMGVDAAAIDPRANGYSPLFHHLSGMAGTVARISAGQFTREGLALIRNECFMDYCESVGDHQTAALYRETIQKDEFHHHQLGRALLAKYATTPELQQTARTAAAETLRLAEEIQEMARLKAEISRAPGC